MLENLIQLVKENAGEAIINNSAIPNEKNDLACETAAGSIFDSLKGMVAGGDFSKITGLIGGSGQNANNEQVSQISDNMTGSLMQKLNLDQGTAGSIVQSLLPSVLGSLSAKTNDPNDNSFSLQGILGALGGASSQGGAVGGILGTVKNLFGFGK